MMEGDVFALNEIDTLDINLPFLQGMLLPYVSYRIFIHLHSIPQIIASDQKTSWQLKCGNGLMLRELQVLSCPHHATTCS